MFDHPIIDVALGVMFLYLILALVCSAVQEWVASMLAIRSKTLHTGIQNLVGDAMAAKVYAHPMIKNLAKPGQLPSYVDPKLISTVVLEVLSQEKGDGKSYIDRVSGDMAALIDSVQEPALQSVLRTLHAKGDSAVDDMRENLAGWFDMGMDRVSGWYGRTVKVWLFVIAAFVTIATNANTLTFAETLWKNDALRTQISQSAMTVGGGSAEDATPQNIQGAVLAAELRELPIGWGEKDQISPMWVMKSIVGWLITIAAVSLGAPFWFDLLGKVARLRGSGNRPAKPADKQTA